MKQSKCAEVPGSCGHERPHRSTSDLCPNTMSLTCSSCLSLSPVACKVVKCVLLVLEAGYTQSRLFVCWEPRNVAWAGLRGGAGGNAKDKSLQQLKPSFPFSRGFGLSHLSDLQPLLSEPGSRGHFLLRQTRAAAGSGDATFSNTVKPGCHRPSSILRWPPAGPPAGPPVGPPVGPVGPPAGPPTPAGLCWFG